LGSRTGTDCMAESKPNPEIKKEEPSTGKLGVRGTQ